MLQRNDKGEEKTLKIALYTLGCKVLLINNGISF